MHDLIERRRALLGPNVSTFYEDPVHIVRGEGVWMWDAEGNNCLDCYNNVPHVGHCNRRVVEAIDDLEASGIGFAALIVCPLFLNEGFPTRDEGWLKPAAEAARRAGGLLICDEVQSGFGRCGSHFWAHQRQGVTPDLVFMGKPMGNGHPVAGLVTSSEIMARFRGAFRYFNTFGGNPVSCTAAMAVLEELEAEDLQASAAKMGKLAANRLQGLAEKYNVIGDVPQSGMVFGAEFVTDRTTKEQASAYADRIINAMRHRGVILSELGRHKNTLKIRPPMPFGNHHLDLLIDTLDSVLAEHRAEA